MITFTKEEIIHSARDNTRALLEKKSRCGIGYEASMEKKNEVRLEPQW